MFRLNVHLNHPLYHTPLPKRRKVFFAMQKSLKLHKKRSFQLKTAHLVTFTEEILKRKLYLLCCEGPEAPEGSSKVLGFSVIGSS